VEFIESKSSISIDPESVIFLELSGQKPVVDFISGNLLVKSADKASDKSLTIKAGEKTLSVADSKVSLSKTNQGEVDVDVLAGQIKGQSEETANKQVKIKILVPAPSDNIYFLPSEKPLVTIEWEKMPGFTVSLEAGGQRNKLSPIKNSGTPGDQGYYQLPVQAGRYYYKLGATHATDKKQTLSSSILSFQVYRVEEIKLYEPKNQEVVTTQEGSDILFRWKDQEVFENVQLEVSTDAQFETKLVSDNVSKKSNHRLSTKLIPSNQNIYWRLKAVFAEGKKSLVSPIYSFQVRRIKNLLAPLLLTPYHTDTIAEKKYAEEGLSLTWQRDPLARSYVIQLEQEGKETKSLKADTSFLKVNELESGKYTWSVASIDAEGNISPHSEKRSFSIADLPQTQWISGDEALYYGGQAQVSLEWQSHRQAKSWRLRMTNSVTKQKTDWIKTYSNRVTEDLSSDGIYTVELEGLDDQGRAVVKAPSKSVLVKASATLPAPQYKMPGNFSADSRGNVELEVLPIKGAKSYQVQVNSAKGEEVSLLHFNQQKGTIEKLKPGQYQVAVRSVDAAGRAGQWGSSRTINVSYSTTLKAPKVKKVSIDE